jgi:SAM-dependent methyltransferase
MQIKYYDKVKKNIVCSDDKNYSFSWESFWSEQVIIPKKSKDYFTVPITSKYLTKGSLIFEGGCGPCDKVYALESGGFKVIGLDSAQSTISIIKNEDKQLKLVTGEVRSLPFKNESFDGYWSLGVIEHFYNGYHGIIKEGRRVLRKDGLMFITFPYMSWLRRLKAALGLYADLKMNYSEDGFYQFILKKEEVIDLCKSFNFVYLKGKPLDGIKGVKDEIKILKPVFQRIYDFRGSNIFLRGLRFLIGNFIVIFIGIGHSYLLILKKK